MKVSFELPGVTLNKLQTLKASVLEKLSSTGKIADKDNADCDSFNKSISNHKNSSRLSK
jgi:hypothetical protein